MWTFFRRLEKFSRPYRVRLILGMICGIIYALSNGLMILVVTEVINLIFPSAGAVSVAERLKNISGTFQPVAHKLLEWLPQLQSPNSSAGKLLVISAIPLVVFVRGVFSYLNIYLVTWAAVRAVGDLRMKLFEHLQNLSLSFFSRARTGDLISRITNDTHVLYGILGNALASLIKDPITILVLLAVLWTQERRLTIISVLVVPTCLVPIIIYGRKVRKSARAMQGHIADLSNLMHESFTANRIIKAYNLEQTVLAQFAETTKKYVGQILRVIRANELPSQLTEFMGSVGVAFVLSYMAIQADATQPSGEFVAFVMSVVLMYQPIKSLARMHNQLHQAEAASQRVFELLDTPLTVVEPAQPVPLLAAGADIQFENVDFDYGEKPILRGINLTVRAGQMIALVGSSGSGKTTLTNLLLRFYDPTSGTVRIGNTDIRQVAIKDLRRQIALVAQETILFNDTVRGNIALGAPDATREQIEAAARAAYAHAFISEKEAGYDTLVGEKGIALSGGQRQRIAIARAILKDAPILILDEATNSLDAASERAVQADLEKLMQGRTTLCIAHRLSTIQNADLIVVLDEGRIVETGNHSELLARKGVYARLYELQFQTGQPLAQVPQAPAVPALGTQSEEPKPPSRMTPFISIVSPLWNEVDNVLPLANQVFAAFARETRPLQLVLVDDASTDGTWERMLEARRADPRVLPVRHLKQSGQSAALWTGFHATNSEIIATLDGDLQNDPADFPKMLELLSEADMVCGARTKRMDNTVRRISSRIARGARKFVLGVDFRDTGCNLRVFKRSVLDSVPPFNGFHRFMPILADGGGAIVREVPVAHRPRISGKSKYGVWNRLGRGVYDLFAIRWYRKRQLRRVPTAPAP